MKTVRFKKDKLKLSVPVIIFGAGLIFLFYKSGVKYNDSQYLQAGLICGIPIIAFGIVGLFGSKSRKHRKG